MEVETAEIVEHAPVGWNAFRLGRAKRLLERGFTPRQVGAKLAIGEEDILRLEQGITVAGEQAVNETHEQWRKRMAERLEKSLAHLAEYQIEAVQSAADEHGCSIDKDTMGTIVDASQIAHKWLRSGEEQTKVGTVNLNFSALAQTDSDANSNGSGQVYEIVAEDATVVRETIQVAPVGLDDWLD